MQGILSYQEVKALRKSMRPQIRRYTQHAENPTYNKIRLQAINEKEVLPTKYVFHCSIGCFLGLEICVIDTNNIPIELMGCDWSCDGAMVSIVIQDEKKTRLRTIKAGGVEGKGSQAQLGWLYSGVFTLSFKTLGPFQFRSECTIVVLEPRVESLLMEMPERLDEQAYDFKELGPARIQAQISTEEVSGTFGFIQSTNTHLRRVCSGSTQLIRTSDTFSTTNTIGLDKAVIRDAQHMNCFETNTLDTKYSTDFQSMFVASSSTQIDLKSKFQTFVAFQPDLDLFPGVIETFIVKYVLNYFEWGWETSAVRDGTSWKLEKYSWQNTAKSDSIKWTPVSWTSTLNEEIREEDWINE